MMEIRNLTINRLGQTMLGPVSIAVPDGAMVAVMGPSGSGKSTLLNWIIGALDTDFAAEGTLLIKGERRDHLPTEKRRIAILFQDDLLFPHWSVGQNLAYALPARLKTRPQRRVAVETALASAGLAGLFDRDPATLSGGQKARAGLLRALLNEPDALLLDEPFSRLDKPLRAEFRALVKSEITRLSIPTLMVTHDEEDVAHGATIIRIGEGNHA